MTRPVLRCAVLLVAAALLLPAAPVPAADDGLFELEPVYVYGRNRKPRMGYRKPEVFDPLSDQMYRAGYKDYPPTAIPEELKNVDAMTRVKGMGRILACADGLFWPFSRTARKNEPAGIEVEILQAIARKHGWEVDMSWVNMVTRFGPGGAGGAYGRSIDKGICDIVMGLTISGDDHHMAPHQLAFTRPFMSTGFVLVTQGPARGATSIDDIKAMGLKLGVPVYSPIHEYVQANGIPYAGFFQNYQVIDALVRGEIHAAMLWSGSISQAKLNNPQAGFDLAKGYVPIPEMRWNSAWVVKEKESELRRFIDEAFVAMLKSGEIRRIVERYGMPFYPPFEEAPGGAESGGQ